MFPFLILTTVYILSQKCTSACEEKNVCENFSDYLSIFNNPNCWCDPNVGATPKEIAERYSASFESYELVTDDGYFISLFRLPQDGKPPVLLIPGVGADSAAYFISGPDSLPFALYNNSYDVWIANPRGTYYAAKHVNYSINSEEYWNFSFPEIGLYDLPAMIDFISEKTGQKGNLKVVAHSMGATSFLVYASQKPEHASINVKFVIFLAPLGYMGHSGSPISRAVIPFCPLLKKVTSGLHLYAIGPNIQGFIDAFHKFCTSSPNLLICALIHFNFDGDAGEKERPSSYTDAFDKFPSGLAWQVVDHFCQLMKCGGRFQEYESGYNVSCNSREYPLENINIPLHIRYGINDLTSRKEDVLLLYQKLKATVEGITETDDSHYTFYASRDYNEFCQFVIKKLEENSY